jgi:DNA-directed RNA polymerase specialized sigma24 family protein
LSQLCQTVFELVHRSISCPNGKQTRATVRDRIQRMRDNYRAVLILRDIEERSTQEVASC